MKEKELSLIELKDEANDVKALSQVQEAIGKFFNINSWQEAVTKFGRSVSSERLLRFRVNLIVSLKKKNSLNYIIITSCIAPSISYMPPTGTVILTE